MDDRSFFDVLYQGWSKTTGAENMFWMPERNILPSTEVEEQYQWDIYAVAQDESRKFIGCFRSEEDAAFITALHGCFADLTRRLHQAVDEADRLDEQKDQREGVIAELALENHALREEIRSLERELDR